MKKLFFLLLISSSVSGQNTFSFKEKIHLKKCDNQYFSQSDRQPLKFVHKDEKVAISVKTFVSGGTDNSGVFYQIDTVTNYNKSHFLNAGNLDFKHEKLRGDVVLSNNKLFFYPKLENSGDSSYNNFIRNHIFFFDIPERSSIDIHFNSWHIGVLTLPLKGYLKTRSDSIKNNVILGANLNIMIGKKWGIVRYYNSPGVEKDKTATRSWSVNAILGVTRVELDNFNTTPAFGTIKTYVTNLSYGVALGYQLNNFGLFLGAGIDSPLSSIGKSWNFSNQPWIGLGLGLGFW